VPKTILAFNGDLESRLALHWLVHELGYEVLTVSINLGQEIYLEPLGEIALELGATAAQIIDRRELFLREFALPVMQAGAVYQTGCFLGSALARYLIAQELARVAHEEGCRSVAHSAASKGNDQVRMETALAALDPHLEVLAPVRQWNLRNFEDKITYAERRRLPIEHAKHGPVAIDRNLWGVSIYVFNATDAWEPPPREAFILTRTPEEAPDEPANFVLRFENGVPCGLNGADMEPLALVRELNRLGGLHAVGRYDVVEDRLFGIKSREFYEVPAAKILLTAHQDLESLVHSKELRQMKTMLGRRYAELVYMGLWFNDCRRALHSFFQETQRVVTGEVQMRLFKGTCGIVGRRSPHSLYDARLANQSNLEFFDNQWAQGFTSVWTLPSRIAAQAQPNEEWSSGWEAP
jgi:argininosuccinate synthase